MRFSRILFTVLIGFCWCHVAHAAGPQTQVFDLGEVRVTDEQNQDKEYAIEEKKVIEKKVLKAHKVVDLAEILSDEMIEATMIRKSGYGNEIALRGFTKSNLRFAQDGALIEGSCGSRKDPPMSHMNLLSVERIEVKEGPYDVTVPGALGGSVNVVTKKPQKEFHGEFLTKMGSSNFWSHGGVITTGTDLAQALFGYNYSQSNQYEDGGNNKLRQFNPGYNDAGNNMDAFQKHDFFWKLQLTPTEDQTLLFSHSVSQGNDLMTPRVAVDTEKEMTYLNKAEYTIENLGDWSDKLKLTGYYNRVEHYPYGVFRTGGINNRRFEAISYIWGTQIENQVSTNWAILTFGSDFYYRNWYGDVFAIDTGRMVNDILFPDVTSTNYGLYLKVERDIGKLSLSGGLRGDIFHSKAKEQLTFSRTQSEENSRTEFFPSAYGYAKYFMSDESNVFAGAGLTNRTPTAVERYVQSGAAYFGNPDLDTASNFEIDAGFETRFWENFQFRTKGFYSYIDDFIYQTSIPARTYTNIDAYIIGYDARLLIDLPLGFQAEGAVAYQRGGKYDQPRGNSDKELAEIPPLKSKLALHYNKNNIFGSLEWIHSERFDRIDSDAGERMLGGWDVVNARIGYEFKKAESHNEHLEKSLFLKTRSVLDGFSFYLGVNNLFDRKYAVANSYEFDPTSPGGANVRVVNEPGRYVYSSVSYKF